MTREEAIKTMDYEKMYKAVLKTATQWIKDGCSDKEKICLESIFPELRESEDERIRKEMIKHFESVLVSHQEVTTSEQVKSWLAYLEKQKEQKPVEWSEKDEKNLELVTDCVYEFYPDPVMKYKLKDWLTQRFKSLRPSWKPSEEQMETLKRASTNEYLSAKQFDILVSLYEQLKKL